MAITPSGTLQSRDETLQTCARAACTSPRSTISDRKVRFYGSTAVVTSLANIRPPPLTDR